MCVCAAVQTHKRRHTCEAAESKKKYVQMNASEEEAAGMRREMMRGIVM